MTQENHVYDPETVDIEDLGLASALVASGIQVVRMRRYSESKVIFEFPECEDVFDLKEQYYNNHGGLKVNAKKMWDSARSLKTQIRMV